MDINFNSDYAVGENENLELAPLPLDSSPTSPPSLAYRPGYQRISPLGEINTEYVGAQQYNKKEDVNEDPFSKKGLAITNFRGRRTPIISRVPVGGKSAGTTPSSADRTLCSADFLLSPSSTRVPHSESAESGGSFDHRRNNSDASTNQIFEAIPDTEHLTTQGAVSRRNSFSGFDPKSQCRSKRNIHRKRSDCFATTILVLSIYSTVFSAIWLLLALIRPRYGQRLNNTGGLSPSTASTIVAALAKTIELSFVSVFVAFLGQNLTHKAISVRSRGISLAQMYMRNWIVQPGSMLTNWESMRYGFLSRLGAVAFIAAIASAVYTTASDALVSPTLRMGPVEDKLIYGHVATSWANPLYIQKNCKTPIFPAVDSYSATTCIEVEHAGNAYSNYMSWVGTWKDNIAIGNGSADLKYRPHPVASLYDNTTVSGSWIHVQNMTETSEKYGRIVNNVSMAMPHTGVFSAARDPLNNIMQPQDLNGLGEYTIGASVPSPVVNVLCAALKLHELDPLVYSTWPNATNHPLNSSTWPHDYGIPVNRTFLNATSTELDDLFGFGLMRPPPIFPKYPQPFNTILNTTQWFYSDTIYLLATSAASNYMLCSMSASLTPNCSTTYHGALSGGSLIANCDDPSDRLAYRNSDSIATNGIRSRDWVNVATDWALSINLNGGINDDNAANARLLTQLIPASNILDVSLPSIAEALAVLSGFTLLISQIDAPFIHYWNYSATVATLDQPQVQAFNGTLQYQDYASGGAHPYQGVFYVVLFLVFLMNVFCLAHFIIQGPLITDFMEPQALFTLSMNSSPSRVLAGKCGGGPEGQDYTTQWKIKAENEHIFFESRDNLLINKHPYSDRSHDKRQIDVMHTFSKLSSKKHILI